MLIAGRRYFLTTLGVSLYAGQTYTPKQTDRPEPLSGDEDGFVPIFDGKSLNNWEGDPKYWRVEDGCLTGEVTPETLLKSNTFIIWRGGSPRDFELKADYRITPGGNSGINYRSIVVPDAVTPANRLAMRGYQADIDGKNAYTGQNYEEKGRLFLAQRGQLTKVVPNRKPILLSSLGDPKDLAAFITPDWNSYHLIINGNTLIHMLNGHVMSVVIDEDPKNRASEGLIGVQVHVGPPMKIQYRNFRIKTLAA
jgi:hypothetical protein